MVVVVVVVFCLFFAVVFCFLLLFFVFCFFEKCRFRLHCYTMVLTVLLEAYVFVKENN